MTHLIKVNYLIELLYIEKSFLDRDLELLLIFSTRRMVLHKFHKFLWVNVKGIKLFFSVFFLTWFVLFLLKM